MRIGLRAISDFKPLSSILCMLVCSQGFPKSLFISLWKASQNFHQGSNGEALQLVDLFRCYCIFVWENYKKGWPGPDEDPKDKCLWRTKFIIGLFALWMTFNIIYYSFVDFKKRLWERRLTEKPVLRIYPLSGYS